MSRGGTESADALEAPAGAETSAAAVGLIWIIV
jgi:hypothetical protein